jgi:tetratricopeptide (TPR) repeat protein
LAWKPKCHDPASMSAEAQKELQERRARIERLEKNARQLLAGLRRPAAPPAPPPSEAARRRLEVQLQELQLARDFFSAPGADPQQFGHDLAEIDARIVALKQSLESRPEAPAPAPGPPALNERAIFDEAIARRPDNPALYVARARHLIAHGEYGEAIAECNHALDLSPTYYAAFNARGVAYLKRKQLGAAIQDFERAIYENPVCDSAFVNLAAAHNAAGAYREAIGPASYASAASPVRHHQLAYAYERLGEYENAVHHLTVILQLDPKGEHVPGARMRRAKQLIKLDRVELAMYDLKTVLAQAPDAAARALLEKLEKLTAASPQEPAATDDGPDVGASNPPPAA